MVAPALGSPRGPTHHAQDGSEGGREQHHPPGLVEVGGHGGVGAVGQQGRGQAQAQQPRPHRAAPRQALADLSGHTPARTGQS